MRGSLEAPEVRRTQERLLPEPFGAEGRAAQGQRAFETQKARHPRLHQTARLRGLDTYAEISSYSPQPMNDVAEGIARFQKACGAKYAGRACHKASIRS